MFSARNMMFANPGIDPDALAYVAAVEVAGATISATQKSAISTFFINGKSAGWLTKIKRLYLPIWSGATANAIDIISRTSGSFVGGVTHSSGYVSSNGSTGYFLLDQAPASLGCTTSSGSIYCLVTAASAINGATTLGGTQDSSNSSRTAFASGGNNVRAVRVFVATAPTYSESDSRSVLIASRTSATTISAYKRTSSGFATTVNEGTATSPVVGTINPMAYMAIVTNGTPQFYSPSTVRFGAYGMGLGLTSSEAESFSLALKTLWENCTGLSLP